MVIGIDASRANRKFKTGTEWYSFELIQALKQIVRADDRVLLYTDVALTGGLEMNPPHLEERVLRWLPIKLWTQLRLSWEMLRRPPDVLFVPAHAIPLIHPKHTIVTIQDIGFERLPELYPWYDRLYHKFAARFAVWSKRVHFIVPTEFTKKEMVSVYHIDENRMTVIPHGYNSTFSPLSFPRKRESTIDGSRLKGRDDSTNEYFLYVGRLERKKNIVGLLHAFAEFKKRDKEQYRLIFVGRRGFGYSEIADTLSMLNLTPFVDEHGWVEQTKMPNLLQNATALILPSFYEGFGLPLFEAFAAGIPVIASAIPALQEVGGDAAYYVPPYHPEMLARALTVISGDQKLRSSLILQGKQRLQGFSWNRAARETLEYIQHVFAHE